MFVDFAHVNGLFNKTGQVSTINQKIAYVLPNYEIRSEKKSPRDKKELQGLDFSLLNIMKVEI